MKKHKEKKMIKKISLKFPPFFVFFCFRERTIYFTLTLTTTVLSKHKTQCIAFFGCITARRGKFLITVYKLYQKHLVVVPLAQLLEKDSSRRGRGMGAEVRGEEGIN